MTLQEANRVAAILAATEIQNLLDGEGSETLLPGDEIRVRRALIRLKRRMVEEAAMPVTGVVSWTEAVELVKRRA